MSIASTGAGIKNLAVGVAIFGGLALLAYVIWKGTKIGKEAADYLGGSSSSRTLGTDIYDAINSEPAHVADPQQVRRTCEAAYPPGSGKRPKPGGQCEAVLGKAWNAGGVVPAARAYVYGTSAGE